MQDVSEALLKEDSLCVVEVGLAPVAAVAAVDGDAQLPCRPELGLARSLPGWQPVPSGTVVAQPLAAFGALLAYAQGIGEVVDDYPQLAVLERLDRRACVLIGLLLRRFDRVPSARCFGGQGLQNTGGSAERFSRDFLVVGVCPVGRYDRMIGGHALRNWDRLHRDGDEEMFVKVDLPLMRPP